MAKYNCIMMDIDNTLLDFDAAERKALLETLQQFSLPCDEAAVSRYHEINSSLWGELNKGKIRRDKLVVERLIDGPENGDSDESGYATIGSDTQILSVTTQDGVCYVNLNGGFLNRKGNVTPEVAVYSIVDSLTEIPGVNRVQISIEGNSDLNYMETISLSQPLEKNTEIIDNAQ